MEIIYITFACIMLVGISACCIVKFFGNYESM